VVCAPLCFAFSKLKKISSLKIKSVINDFFDDETISAAKSRLLHDSQLIEADNLPRLPNRRDSEGRLRKLKEVDDIMTLLTTLDERKLLGELPRYVVDDTDSIPTLKLEDGDLKYFVQKMDRFEESLTHLQACLNRLPNSGENRPAAVSKVVINQNNQTEQPSLSGLFAPTDVNTAEPTTDTWAARLSKGLSDQVNTSDMDTDNIGEFNEVVNSRRKKRRLRRSPQLPSQPSNQQTSQQTVKTVKTGNDYTASKRGNDSTGNKGKRRQPLVIGRREVSTSGSSTHTTSMTTSMRATAKPLLDKEVFYVDNVDVSLDAADLTEFVKAMNVRVVSCLNANPRRTMKQRREEEYPDDRKAFRLCIVKNDRDNLLIADNWPTNITVSSWFFKKPATDITATATATALANDPDKTVRLTDAGNGS
jgi:hypothetical protein